MSMKTPNFMTTEAYTLQTGLQRDKVLPVGSFVRPIEETYLPSHIKESSMFRWCDRKLEMFVYSHFGIIVIPKDIVRRL